MFSELASIQSVPCPQAPQENPSRLAVGLILRLGGRHQSRGVLRRGEVEKDVGPSFPFFKNSFEQMRRA